MTHTLSKAVRQPIAQPDQQQILRGWSECYVDHQDRGAVIRKNHRSKRATRYRRLYLMWGLLAVLAFALLAYNDVRFRDTNTRALTEQLQQAQAELAQMKKAEAEWACAYRDGRKTFAGVLMKSCIRTVEKE